MTTSLKGAFLSGLVFPGMGHVFFKHYKKGLALMLTVMICLLIIVATAVKKALAIFAQLELEGEVIDLKTISSVAAEASYANGSFMTLLPWLLIISCWVFGTIDAYRIGKKKESEKNG